jgi:kelch-like protein 17 (actinfilin)/kelch-like protein 20
VGGYNDDNGVLSSVERYDPATNAWEAVAPMATAR